MDYKPTDDWFETFSPRQFGPDELEELASSQLEHALDARRRGLKIYESLKSLNEVIGTQYGDRVLFELVQNAHDAHNPDEHGEISIKLVVKDDLSGMLYIANRGRSFTFSNFDAIRNIGTSDKEIGEGIGNKGLGFRSVEALTDDPRVYSQIESQLNEKFYGYCFRFAYQDEIEDRLKKSGAPESIAAQVAQNISRYLVPLPLDEQPEEVLAFAAAGFVTVVELPLRSREAVELAKAQATALVNPDAPLLLFLDRVAKLNIEIIDSSGHVHQEKLTRQAREVDITGSAVPITLHEVKLNSSDPLLVFRRVLPKHEVLAAVQESIPFASNLKRWLEWKGDAVVSIAVGSRTHSIKAARLFNFLPMDGVFPTPIHGYVDAPFFADIDRRSINADLPLNNFLLEAAAETCAAAALTIAKNELAVPASSVVDLVTWSKHHVKKIVKGFVSLGQEFTSADIWPIVADRGSAWSNLDYLYAWPEVRTKILNPRRLAKEVDAEILLGTLGNERLVRIENLARSVSKPLEIHEAILCEWIVRMANVLAETKRTTKSMWRDFYDDVVTLFSATAVGLSALQGKRFLLDSNGRLLESTPEGSGTSEPIFVRQAGIKGRKNSGPPKPPSSLSRRLKFLDDKILLSEDALQAFEKAGLVRRYDALEVLGNVATSLGRRATDIQRRDSLQWAFRVWRETGGGRVVETALRRANLFVPTSSNWAAASEAFFSSSWTSAGRLLEPFLREAAEQSSDCAFQRDRLLTDYSDWPVTSTQDRKADWMRFLEILRVRDGLHPIAGKMRRSGTPSNYWHSLFLNGNPQLGLGPSWTSVARTMRLTYPQTEYSLQGECWRFPGQLEHEGLSPSAREAFSELIVAYLKENGDAQFEFEVVHRRNFESEKLPTPAQVFLREAEWMLTFRRDEADLRRPRDSWSTLTPRQVPPRFVDRFAAEPGLRASAPTVLFDKRIGLRDWTSANTASERLISLADAVSDLSTAERRDLREQLRRAWADVSKENLSLPSDMKVVVEHATGLDCLKACSETLPVVYLTSERESFAARALIDQGAAVLDLGEADSLRVSTLLEQTGGFIPRPIDAGDVRLLVDDVSFEPAQSDPLLVAGARNWLSDAVVLAHEFLGDPFELRTLPPETVEQRIRQIRVRKCMHFSIVIGDHQVSSRGHERAHPFPHARLPTLVVEGTGDINIEMLVEAAPAITKLVGARRNTLETMLNRLIRHGFNGGAAGPTDEQYALAIHREVSIIRDHFAATRGGVERRVRAVLPIVHILVGADAADELAQRYTRLGPLFHLQNWLNQILGLERAETIWKALEETDEQIGLRRRLGLPFAEYNAALRALGYPPLNDEADFRRIFEVYLNDMRPALLDRVRRRHKASFLRGDNLESYLAHKELGFVSFVPDWPLTMEVLDKQVVEEHIHEVMEAVLGPDDLEIELPDFRRVTSANQKMALAAHPRMASLVRAWCRRFTSKLPELMDPSDGQPLVKALQQAGLFDFERLLPDQLPLTCKTIGAWPADMPATFDLVALSLTEADLDFEDREAREERKQAEVARRSIDFAGSSLDTGATDFAQALAEISESALAGNPDWFSRSRAPRLKVQEQSGNRSDSNGSGGAGKGRGRRDQPPEPIRRAMGMASEYLVREYLLRRHPKEMTDRCWVSENRVHFCSDGEKGNDSLGYDFRVVTQRNEWLYEVKSALDEGGEFELTARELEVAGSAATDRKRRYRILYVPFVFDPSRWRVLTLQNPVGEATRNRFRVIRTGSVRYGFDVN